MHTHCNYDCAKRFFHFMVKLASNTVISAFDVISELL